jgi:hypothetical protein
MDTTKGGIMKVNKTQLLSAMKKAMPGVETGSSMIEGADTFVFSPSAIHSYNDNISVSVPFSWEGEMKGSVKSMDFFKLIGKLPVEDINIEITAEAIKLSSGMVDAEMVLLDNNLNSYLSELKIEELSWKDLPDNFFEAVKLCKISCNRAPQRGIFVEKNYMLSTDISRINHHKLNTEMERFWLDDPAVGELLKIKDIKSYCITESWAHFKSEEGVIFSCKRKADASYPAPKILEWLESSGTKGEEDIEGQLPKELYEAVDRVATLSGEIDGLPAIQMIINKDTIELNASRYAGKIKEKIKLEKPFETDLNIKIWVDPFFLTEASKKVDGFYIKPGDRKVLVFYNENYTQIASTFKGE